MNAKKTFFLLIILTLQISSFSQILVEENRVWSVAIRGTDGDTYITEQTTFMGEVTIDGIQYLKVYQSDKDPYEWQFINAYIREASGIVYFKYENESEEILYDFNIDAGDSIVVGKFNLHVDSVVTKDLQGKMLKHWYFSYSDFVEVLWIEKYGSTNSLLNPFAPITVTGADFYLLCVSINEEVWYMNTDFNTCYYNTFTSGVPGIEMEQPLLQVSVNPEGLLSVTMKESIKGQLYLYTTNGQLLGKEMIDQAHHEFCIHGEGIALYRFISGNGAVQSGKIPLQP
jgi:hypothetical protein